MPKNEDHERLVLSGAIHLNPWRAARPDERLELEGAVLERADLSGCDLSGANLLGAQLIGANLEGAVLRDAVLIKANLSNANLTGANLDRAVCRNAGAPNAVFTSASCVLASFDGANLNSSNFAGANLSGANLQGANISGIEADGIVLDGASLNPASLQGAKLTNAQLRNANLGGAALTRADLSGATVSGTNFYEADLTDCILAHLKGVTSARFLIAVRTNARERYFDSCERPWPERYLDWERIRGIGRFQLFGVSYSLLLYLITSFYVLGQYNKKVEFAREYLEQVASDDDAPRWERSAAKKGLGKLNVFSIAPNSIILLGATMLLVVASGLYTVGCPEEIKEFTRVQWCYQLNRSLIHYWGYAWQRKWLRVACATLYAVGGLSFLIVTLMKMVDAVRYAWQYVGA